MKNDDVDDDIEELLAARARMMRSHAVALHKSAHVFDDEALAPAGWPAENDLGFKMTEDPDDADSAPARGEGKLLRLSDYLRKITPQPSVMPDLDADTDDPAIEALQRAHERSNEPLSTAKSIAEGEEFQKELRLAAISSLQRRVESGELIPLGDLVVRLQLDAAAIDSAVKDGRLFAIADPGGVNYYPVFYANPRYDRCELERVIKQLGDVPATIKYHFFTNKVFSLGGKTPLEALAERKLDDVLRAATSCVER